MTTYIIGEYAPGGWAVIQTNDDGTQTVMPKKYTTAAEAYDDLLGMGVTASQITINTLPASDSPNDVLSVAYDPLMPLGWESLPPLNSGLELPEIEQSEMIKVLLGDFNGLKFKLKISSAGSFVTSVPGTPPSSFTDTWSGTSEIDYILQRKDGLHTYVRNTDKPLDYSPPYVGPLDATPYFDLLPLVEVSKSHHQRVSTPPDPHTDFSQDVQLIYAVNLFYGVGFHRKSNSDACQLYFHVSATAGAGPDCQLTAFANVTGADPWDYYGFLYPPPSSTASVMYTSISGDGPSVFGVTTKQLGYSATGESTSAMTSGSQTFTPSIEIANL